MMKTEKRKFPYPYKAAFSFCNDCDLMTEERYLFLKEFFRTFPASAPSAAPGLPYCESFFIHNHNKFHAEQLSLSSHRDLLGDDIRSGYLSIMHTWGDYNFNPIFDREHAKAGFEMLSEMGATPRIWVNHGTLHNLQNIGSSAGYGDAREYLDGSGRKYPLSTYHLDYVRKLGIEFFWIGRLTLVPGQNARLDATTFHAAYYSNLPASATMTESLIRMGKRYLYLPMKVKGISNSLLWPVTLRDGSSVFEFIRFGSHDRATAEDLHKIIPPETINRLIDRESAMVFYTHLGKTKLPADRMADDTMEVIEYLKRKYDEGSLWIVRLDRLLEYESLRDSMDFEQKGSRIIINSFTNQVKGRYHPSADRLAGLTFYCRKPEMVSVYYLSKPLGLRVNPKDFTGRVSITVTGAADEGH